jgi:hypothetical protein
VAKTETVCIEQHDVLIPTALMSALTQQRQLYITQTCKIDNQHYRNSIRRWSKTQAAAKKIDEFQIRTFVIQHSSFVFWLLKQFCGHPALRI